MKDDLNDQDLGFYGRVFSYGVILEALAIVSATKPSGVASAWSGVQREAVKRSISYIYWIGILLSTLQS
jgi:hypothetical protein